MLPLYWGRSDAPQRFDRRCSRWVPGPNGEASHGVRAPITSKFPSIGGPCPRPGHAAGTPGHHWLRSGRVGRSRRPRSPGCFRWHGPLISQRHGDDNTHDVSHNGFARGELLFVGYRIFGLKLGCRHTNNEHPDHDNHDDRSEVLRVVGLHRVGADMSTVGVDTVQPEGLEMGNPAPHAVQARVAARSMQAIGTTVSVAVTDSHRADDALELLAAELRSLDEACSRFRPDSEIRRVEALGQGLPTVVSPLLFQVIDAACRVAVETAGIVDPTVGSALVELGYDRDFSEIDALEQNRWPDEFVARPAPGWWRLGLDPAARTVSIPSGVHVDLGATAKAFAADQAAARLSAALDCGVLVNLGGDVAVAGPAPDGGWAIGIAAECTMDAADVDQVVSVVDGGLATSGTTARTWMRDGRRVHHIVDPWTGEAAPAIWSLVSVAAPSCVEANSWSTAAVVWGKDAVDNLTSWGVPARLVDAGGSVTTCGDWPLEGASSTLRAVQLEGSAR
jgi:FAD:protein FMN transferase